MTPGLIKSYKAEAAVEAFRIVKYGAADDQVVKGAAVGDKLIGISTGSIDAAIGDMADVVRAGPAEVRCGAAVTRGDRLTTDANGKAVNAAPGAGVNNQIVAIADQSGVLDDIIRCTITLGTVQG